MPSIIIVLWIQEKTYWLVVILLCGLNNIIIHFHIATKDDIKLQLFCMWSCYHRIFTTVNMRYQNSNRYISWLLFIKTSPNFLVISATVCSWQFWLPQRSCVVFSHSVAKNLIYTSSPFLRVALYILTVPPGIIHAISAKETGSILP